MLTDFGGWLAEHATVVAAAVSAIATAFIAVFTLKLTGATAGQLKRLDESIRLARDEFNATHRPEFVIREVVWKKSGNAIAFTLINRGRAPGTVIESAFAIRGSPLDGSALRTNGVNLIGSVTLQAGEFQFCECVPGTEEEGMVSGMRGRGIDAHYLQGIITYADSNGVRRRFVLARACQGESDRFVPTGDPDDEYTD